METGFGLSDIHRDIILTHILPRLDGRTLAAVSCVSSNLRTISTAHHLWSHICHSTWPSTNTPRLRHVILSFPNGPLSFFAHSFQPLHAPSSHLHRPPSSSPYPKALISAVDLFYKGEPALSKAQETETAAGWFKSAPFRIDLLDPKEVVPTPIVNPDRDDMCKDLYRDLELSWIVIDPIGLRAINVSSRKPVSVHRRWLTGEVQAKFAVVMEGAGVGGETVAWEAEVTCVPGEARMMVKEVGLEVVGVEGVRLSGKESVEVLRRGLEWGCGGDWAAEEGRRRVTEKRKKHEGRWDLLCVGMVITALMTFGFRLVASGGKG